MLFEESCGARGRDNILVPGNAYHPILRTEWGIPRTPPGGRPTVVLYVGYVITNWNVRVARTTKTETEVRFSFDRIPSSSSRERERER